MELNKVNTPYYYDYGTWIRSRFPFRVQKISIDAGFTCPNRDGRLSTGGCIYCDNRTFNPAYCQRQDSITLQLEAGKLYEEALQVEDVVGIVIGTRPDCVSDALLDYLEALNQRCFLIVEYGVESANDETLRRINRGHTSEQSRVAIEKTHQRGILTGAHIILGLPGEDAHENLRQASIISALPIDILKIHQMQIIRGTRLADEYTKQPFHIYSVDAYIRLVAAYIQRLRKDLVLERFVSQSPKNMRIAPHWGLKNHEFTDLLNNYLKENDIHQGDLLE